MTDVLAVRDPDARRSWRPLPWSAAAPLIQVAAIAGAWTAASLASYARYQVMAAPAPAPRLTLVSVWLLCYVPWAAATPLLAHLVARFPLRGPRWPLHALIMVALGAPIIHLVVVASQALFAVTGLASQPFSLGVAPATFFLEALVYAGASGVLEGLRRGAEARQRECDLAALQVQRLELENGLRDAQLEALRMKLNPHFLFNALQTVTALMRADPPAAQRMLARLGDVLRMALRLDLASESRLADELDVARAYLDLERIRFQDRLSVAFDVDAASCDALVPSLLLQPVVENAIRHGVGRLRRRVELRIGAHLDAGQVCISVADNGVGFPDPEGRAIVPGVGLGTLQSRLEKLYPGAAECRLRNRPEGGAEVQIRVPFHTTPAAAGVPA